MAETKRRAAVEEETPDPAVTPPAETDTATAADEVPEPASKKPEPPGGRRMPEHVRRHLIRVQGGRMYLPTAYRLVWFREECADWSIMTDLIEGGQQAGFATAKATVLTPDGRVIATGMKTETKADFPAGWVEKAETGAIGRALAVTGYGTQFSVELDEDAGDAATRSENGRASAARAADRRSAEPMVDPDELWAGPGQCPRCHAPEGKRHGKPCRAV